MSNSADRVEVFAGISAARDAQDDTTAEIQAYFKSRTAGTKIA
jgi:hypothetical protein